jgi:ribosomal protein L7/L12
MNVLGISFIVVAVLCLGGILALVIVTLALWMQNAQADREQFTPDLQAAKPAPDDLAEQIGDLLAEKRKIEAIKVYREATGAGLKEAKEAVEELESGGSLATPEKEPESVPFGLEGQVRDLLAQGDKIEAIKLYRGATGSGLQEAKEALESMEWGESLAHPQSPVKTAPAELEAQLSALLAQGKKIDAVKLYRQATGLGLKESKDAVDLLERLI